MNMGNRKRRILGWVLALALAAIFGLAGGWKLYDPGLAARQQVALGLPAEWATPLVVLLGSVELLTAALVLVPSLRRSGAALATGLTVLFLLYVGINYSRVQGKECGCLPGRSGGINATFFLEDGLLLAAAAASVALSSRTAWTARRAAGLGMALVLLAGVGWTSSRLDKPLFASSRPLVLQMMDRSGKLQQHGYSSGDRFLIYFENPACANCLFAAQTMSKLSFQVPFVVLPSDELKTTYTYLDGVGLRNAQVAADYEAMVSRLRVERIPSLFLMDGSEPRALVVDFKEPNLSRRLRELGVLK